MNKEISERMHEQMSEYSAFKGDFGQMRGAHGQQDSWPSINNKLRNQVGLVLFLAKAVSYGGKKMNLFSLEQWFSTGTLSRYHAWGCGCDWHQVGQGQGWLLNILQGRRPSPHRTIQPRMSVVARLRNPGFEKSKFK